MTNMKYTASFPMSL